MRILHITEYCHAGSVGGTERYILDLIRGLDAAGFQNSIGWLTSDRPFASLEVDGVRITKLPAPPMRVDAPLPEFHAAAIRLLETEKPDLLHFHTFGLTEAAFAILAKQRGVPYAFTYHSPAWTCRRETMLLYGKEPCDGEVRAWRCSACQSEERLGCGKLAGYAATAVSMAAGWTTLLLSSTRLRRRTAFFYDTMRYRAALRIFLSKCNVIISCCDWSGPVLKRNGARKESIFHCPQGVSTDVAAVLYENSKTDQSSMAKEFVVGYVGRVVEIKGVHILMEGFSRTAGKDVRLRIVGWDTEHTDLPYAQRLLQLAQSDPRITLVPKQSFAGTLDEYRKMALLAVPSISIETGPLTMLEAFTLEVPVYGSNRIGQLNLLIAHGKAIVPNTPDAWQEALTVAFGRWRLGYWNKGLIALPLRTMSGVASEMAECYRNIST